MQLSRKNIVVQISLTKQVIVRFNFHKEKHTTLLMHKCYSTLFPFSRISRHHCGSCLPILNVLVFRNSSTTYSYLKWMPNNFWLHDTPPLTQKYGDHIWTNLKVKPQTESIQTENRIWFGCIWMTFLLNREP
jgi:hypothetical protein